MTKDVYITVTGVHRTENETGDPIITHARGRYYKKNGMHYLFFDEELGDSGLSVRNVFRFNDRLLDVKKSGGTESHMVFEQDKLNVSEYKTGAGILEMGVKAGELLLNEDTGKLEMKVRYELFAGGSRLQESEVTVTAVPYPFL